MVRSAPSADTQPCNPVSGQGEDGKVRNFTVAYLSRPIKRDSRYYFPRSHRPLTTVAGDLPHGFVEEANSAKEVERMLGVSYETAWHMRDRIREAMRRRIRRLSSRNHRVIGV